MSSNKRRFERYDKPTGMFNISMNKRDWYEIGLEDVSAGGMKFTSPATFDVEDTICAQLVIRNKLKDNILQCDGVIRRKAEIGQGLNSYAVEFLNLKDSQLANLSEIMFFVK